MTHCPCINRSPCLSSPNAPLNPSLFKHPDQQLSFHDTESKEISVFLVFSSYLCIYFSAKGFNVTAT